MDLVSAPRGESPPLKSPLVEVEAAEVEEALVTENALTGEKGAISQSEYETDSDGLEDEWETQSLYEDAIQVLRDEQLRDGCKYCMLHSIKSPARSLYPVLSSYS
jgi:hypothetical protein